MIRPGEIYWADAGGGRHKLIVVSREELNRGNTILALLVTSKRFDFRSKLPNCVTFRAGEFGFSQDCTAPAESLSRIRLDDLDLSAGPVAVVDDTRKRDVIRTIGYAIDAECEPC